MWIFISTLIIISTPSWCENCGIPSFKPKTKTASGNRIVGGEEARPHSFPWQVELQVANRFWCGATLIESPEYTNSSDLILTAGHCLHDPADLSTIAVANISVVLGSHDRNQREPYEEVIKAQRYEFQFDPDTFIPDIGLIKLEKPVQFNEYIKPICVADMKLNIPFGKLCTVSGWGSLQELGNFSVTLQQVNVRIYEPKKCKGTDRKAFCAGFLKGGKDSCQGDSGGPLICLIGDKYVQFGIVSHGEGCALPGEPGKYTNVRQFSKWIGKQKTNFYQ